MTISKEVLLNRYADHLSDLFPKRRIRDREFSGYVFTDKETGNQFYKTIEVVSRILEKIFPSDIDLRSLQFVGHLIEEVCKGDKETLLPWPKVSFGYQQFLQTLGSFDSFAIKIFPPINLEIMRLLSSGDVFVKEDH